MAIFQALGDAIWQGRALWAQAYAHDQLGQARERDRAAGAALALARKTGDQEGIGAAANLLYREHADMALRLKGLKQSLIGLPRGRPERARRRQPGQPGDGLRFDRFVRARAQPGRAAAGRHETSSATSGIGYFATMLSVIEGHMGHLDNARRLPKRRRGDPELRRSVADE